MHTHILIRVPDNFLMMISLALVHDTVLAPGVTYKQNICYRDLSLPGSEWLVNVKT